MALSHLARVFKLLLAFAFIGSVESRAFTSATDMRNVMEQEVGKSAVNLQRDYADIRSSENIGGTCPSVQMCTQTGSTWSAATRDAQFLDPSTGTCTRRDRDAQGARCTVCSQCLIAKDRYCRLVTVYAQRAPCICTAAAQDHNFTPALPLRLRSLTHGHGNLIGNYLTTQVTGRKLHTTANSACSWSQVTSTRPYQLNTEDQEPALIKSGCFKNTTAADLASCSVLQTSSGSGYGVTWPDSWSYTTSSSLVKAEICATNRLTPQFAQTKRDYNETGWQFLGLQHTGIYRSWPALFQCRTENICSGCSDPRFRGWYASAASGAKDVVLVIDTSGSMNEMLTGTSQSRMSIAKSAAKWVLNTLTEVDRASMVDYASYSTKYSSTLQKITAVRRRDMVVWVDQRTAYGSTNMYEGFADAFAIFKASDDASANKTDTTYTTRCSKVILFLTDGLNSGKDPTLLINSKNNGPYSSAHKLNSEHVRIFTYAFGTEYDPCQPNLMKQIACQNGGIYNHVPISKAASLKEIMASYYVYLAAGMSMPSKGKSAAVSWAEPYWDGQGLGKMTAACARVYDFTKNPVELFGIMCLGVSTKTAQNFTDWDATWSQMVADRAKCRPMSLDWAQLESLRAHAGGTQATCDRSCVAPEESSSEGMGIIIGVCVCAAVIVSLLLYSLVCRSKDKKRGQPLPAPMVIIGRPQATAPPAPYAPHGSGRTPPMLVHADAVEAAP